MNSNSTNSSGPAFRKSYYSHSSGAAQLELKPLPESTRPFSKKNILMMVGCLALIIIGFALMSGGGSSVEGGFNPDIFSTRRIVIGPTLAFLGFLLMAFAIIYSPASGKGKQTDKAVQEDSEKV